MDEPPQDAGDAVDEFEVVFYRTANGAVPMDELLDSLESKLRVKVDHDLHALREQANMLREPHSKSMGEGLFELRIRQGNDIVRAFYFFFVGRMIVVTNGFVKKTQKTPRREIARALAYKADWKERFDNG